MENYRINPMGDRGPPEKENFPRQGLVNDVCREFLLHEDQALAYRLQTEEYQNHLGINKERNAQLRQDTPRAREEQLKEDEEAAKVQTAIELAIAKQEARDASLAAAMARDIESQDYTKKKEREKVDMELAKKIFDEDKRRLRQNRESSHTSTNEPLPGATTDEQENRGPSDVLNVSDDLSDLSDFCIQPSTNMDEEEMRILQEEQDEELSRLLTEQDVKRRGDFLKEDQLRAIEAQDRELAKVLQEQERAKLKKAKEKARQKNLLKKQQRNSAQPKNSGESSEANLNRPTVAPLSNIDHIAQASRIAEREQLKSGGYPLPKHEKSHSPEPPGYATITANGPVITEHHYDLPNHDYDVPCIDPSYSRNLPSNVQNPVESSFSNLHIRGSEQPVLVNPFENFHSPPTSPVKPSNKPFLMNEVRHGIDHSTTSIPDLLNSTKMAQGQRNFGYTPTKGSASSRSNRVATDSSHGDGYNRNHWPLESHSPSVKAPQSANHNPGFTNIACAIDPTYQRRVRKGELTPPIPSNPPTHQNFRPESSASVEHQRHGRMSEPTASIPHRGYVEEDDDVLPPPYMPLQGQRRSETPDKRRWSKDKESGCKQQ